MIPRPLIPRPLILVAAAAAALLLLVATGAGVAPAAAGDCGPCLGPQQTVTGHGSGSDCAQALDAARRDAYVQAFEDAPACTPCQITAGPRGCFVAAGGGYYVGAWTLHYDCKTCVPPSPRS